MSSQSNRRQEFNENHRSEKYKKKIKILPVEPQETAQEKQNNIPILELHREKRYTENISEEMVTEDLFRRKGNDSKRKHEISQIKKSS